MRCSEGCFLGHFSPIQPKYQRMSGSFPRVVGQNAINYLFYLFTHCGADRKSHSHCWVILCIRPVLFLGELHCLTIRNYPSGARNSLAGRVAPSCPRERVQNPTVHRRFVWLPSKVENTASVVFFRCSQTKRHLLYNCLYGCNRTLL